jgi:hypothetical protein
MVIIFNFVEAAAGSANRRLFGGTTN